MAFALSCRRSVLQQRPFLQELAKSIRHFSSAHLQAKDEKPQEIVRKEAEELTESKGSEGQFWKNPISNVFNYVDHKLDYFRPAYATQSETASLKALEEERKPAVNEAQEQERGNLGSDEGARASTSFGGDIVTTKRGASKVSTPDVDLGRSGKGRQRQRERSRGSKTAKAGLSEAHLEELRSAEAHGNAVDVGGTTRGESRRSRQKKRNDLDEAAKSLAAKTKKGAKGDGTKERKADGSVIDQLAGAEEKCRQGKQKESRRSQKEVEGASNVTSDARGNSKPEQNEQVSSEDGFVQVSAMAPALLQGDPSKKGGKKKRGAKKEEENKLKLPPLPDAQALYVQMLDKEKLRKGQPLLTITMAKGGGKENAVAVVKRFTERGWASDQALALYVNHELFPVVAARFKKLVLKGCTEELKEWFAQVEPSDEAEEALFPLFAELCLQEFREELRHFRKLVESANLTEPQRWYPYARAMKRKVIYHCGPTNSGKTYEALQRLKQADNGIYCGPLRLLAMEIFDTLNQDGIYCNLTTGQERRTVPFANHTSCTVEMAHLGNEYEVAVIDEIQMMADDHRGWAWTRAFLGLQAKEIHVCGDSSVLQMLKRITKTCGDELTVHNYKRWKQLKVEKESLDGSWKDISEGDCVVAFSRKEIFQIKEEIEAQGKHKCCVIYGALPPETRRQQARLFNDPDSGYDVLVASDAIGMGLNLNIRRMIFSKMEKFSGGTGKEQIPTSMVKQIAGRAGRRNSSHSEGFATTFRPDDLPKLSEAMAAPLETARKGGLFPIFEQMELFAGQLPDMKFPELLDKFAETSLLDSSYFLCKHDQIRTVAQMLEKVPSLTLRDRFSLCQAPINSRSLEAMTALLRFAKAYAEGGPVPLGVTFREVSADIAELEWKHQVVSAYLWLSYQLQETQFPHRATAEELLASMVTLLDQRLAGTVHLARANRSRSMKKRAFVPIKMDRSALLKKLTGGNEAERPKVAALM